jgi:hypothetical protein
MYGQHDWSDRQASRDSTHVSYVASSEQDLGYGLPEMIEKTIPQAHQTALTNCRQSLEPISC